MTDVLLTDDGDLPKNPKHGSSREETAQRVGAALALFEGEWRADEREGIPWLDWLGEIPPPVDEMVSVLPSEIAQVDGVEEVTDFAADFRREDGVLEFEATVRETTTGEEAALELTFDLQQPNFHPILTLHQ